jgi:hypothetical protein
MRKLANLFFILYILMAVTAILCGGGRLFGAPSALDIGYNLLRVLTIIVAIPLYFGLAFNRHLPRLILIPLFLWLFWGLCGHWPLQPLLGDKLLLLSGCGQLGIVWLLLQLNRRHNGRSLLLIPRQFAGNAFSGNGFVHFIIINIFAIPVALILVFYFGLGTLIADKSAGFVQLQPTGLYMSDRVYRLGDKEVRLSAMIHLGQGNYYSDLTESLPQRGALILAEGVSDEDGLMTENFSYGKLADALGVETQQQLHFPGRLIDAAQLLNPTPELLEGTNLLPADIDLREFDKRTIAVLNALARDVLSADNPLAGYSAFNHWLQQEMPADIDKIIMNDLIAKRNCEVYSYLTQALPHYNSILIPWGALHMPGIERKIKQLGFQLHSEQRRKSIDFLLLPYGDIWHSLTAHK